MKRFVPLVLAVLALPQVALAAGSDLLAAIRADQPGAVRRLLDAGEDVNSRDESQATALMYATVYSSADVVRLLLGRGADVNAANATGATALMWAAGDVAISRALLERGAALNAKSGDGSTALLVAARYGNTDVVRALLAAGADVNAVSRDGLLRAAFSREDGGELRRLLADAGVDVRDPAQLTPLLGLGLPMTNYAAMKRIVAAGGSFKSDVQLPFLKLSPLHLASYHGDVAMMRSLLDTGAALNAATSQGATPLMFAAASPRPNLEAIRLLLTRGADLTVKDTTGRTAMDWSLTQGETPVSAMLRTAGAPASAPAAAPPSVSTPRTTRDAVERAIAKLQPAGPGFSNRTKCISCHNQSLPSLAVGAAIARGVTVDRAVASHPSQATITSWRPTRDSLLLGRQTIGGFVANVTYGLVSLADDGIEPSLTTDAVAIQLAALQEPDGSWNIDDLRPPIIDQSAVHFTALAIRGLTVYSPPGRAADVKARIARATAYLRTVTTGSTQDEAFKLLGLIWAGVPRDEIARQAQRVLSLQRESGGWAQVATMAPDAYATGQALYALRVSGLATDASAYQRGTTYLLRTQLEDGTWFVRSRAFGFQAYFESGFPHGRDQFISSAATSWAALALAQSLPVLRAPADQ